MKRFALTAVLVCMLSVTAFAGSIPSGDAPTPGNTQGPTMTVTVILTILSLVR